MATYRYKVRSTDSWSTIAKGVGTTVQRLMKANPGVTSLSQGMGIRVPPVNQGLSPYGGYNPSLTTPGVTPLGGAATNASSINGLPGPFGVPLVGNGGAGVFSYSNITNGNLFGTQPTENGARQQTPSTPGAFTDMTDRRNSGSVSSVTNIGTSDTRYSQNSNPYTPNVVWMYDSSGNPIMKPDGSQASRPRFVMSSDIPLLAQQQGVDPLLYVKDMQASGYVLFGGVWVYQGATQTETRDTRPPRLANGNLVRRRGENDLTWSERRSGKLNPEHQQRYDEAMGNRGGESIGNSATNFGVGTG